MRLFRSVLALESRFFDSLTAGNAAQQLGEGEVDLALLKRLESHEKLIDALDAWITMPDRHLYPRLSELARLVQSECRLPPHQTLYRGFDPQSRYQNTMGLSDRGLLSNEEVDYSAGSVHRYEGATPVSFTTDESIARAFGKVVVRTEVNPQKDHVLCITPELTALVCKRRNIATSTQREVIALPPVALEFTVHAIR